MHGYLNKNLLSTQDHVCMQCFIVTFRYTLSTDNADLSKQVVEYVMREATASMGSPGSGSSARYHRDNQHQPETDRDHHYGYDDDQVRELVLCVD